LFDFLKSKTQNKQTEKVTIKKSNHKVVVYSTPSCVWCNEVKKYLKRNKIDYKDYDISNNLVKKMEMVKLSGQMGVPVVTIDGKVIVGFDKKEIDKILINGR
jgi:glutaredoxin-like YruB-family protein